MKTQKTTEAALSSSAVTAKTAGRSAAASRKAAGAHVPRQVLQQQATAFLSLSGLHAAALARFGWTEADARELRSLLEAFDRAAEALAEQRHSAAAVASGAAAVLAEAVSLRSELLPALRVVRVRKPAALEGVNLAAGRAGRSAMALAAWFNDIKPAVRRVEAELRRLLHRDVLAAIEHHRSALLATSGGHLASRRALSEAVETAARSRQALSAKIDYLLLCAKGAFALQPSLKRQFRKGIAARHKAPVAAPPAPAANEPVLQVVTSAA
jgi:hypothetical protein